MNLKGKRLLLLGGSLWKEAIKSYANRQGITLIATGNNQSAGIFEIADEIYDVDSTNSEEMKKLIKEKNIDGVYMGGSETVISKACEYLNELNLPCYCTKQQWVFLQNKIEFKKVCSQFGLPVVRKYEINMENWKTAIKTINFPVITKPADGCGSNGFSICNNEDELLKGYKKAEEISDSKNVIVEDFVKNDSVVVFYTVNNGKLCFSGLEEKFPIKYETHSSYIAGALVFESDSTEKFRNNFEKQLQNMVEFIGIKEGSIWMEVFHCDNNFYFNEAGFRYGGSVSIYPIDYYYNINQVASDINYALIKNNLIDNKDVYQSIIPKGKDKKRKYCVYSLPISSGIIEEIHGINYLKDLKNIIAIPVTKNAGDEIQSSGTIAQVFGFVHFVFDTKQELFDTIDKIHQNLKVIDDKGNNMVQRLIDPNLIVQRFSDL